MKDLFFIFVLWAWVLCTPASVLADSRPDQPFPDKGRPVADGSIIGIDGYNLTLTGRASTTYVVDASNAVIDKMPSSTLSFADLKIGDNLMVFGTTTNTGIVANKIVYALDGRGGGQGDARFGDKMLRKMHLKED